MLDVAIRGGTVVDGTGRPGWRADVGIANGRIVEVGRIDDDAARTFDAGGRVVCPGFVDVHTHYDAQLFWDPTFSPSPLHGVTTVVAGNCGISLAPIARGDEDFMARLLSRVEAIPLESLTQGLTFGWSTFPEFLDAVDGLDLAVNVGFLLGHSALRRYVMGEAASADHASRNQLDRMRMLLGEGIAAGALGFSSSKSATQLDGDGRPTPPNFASDEELIAFATVTGEHAGTSLEFIPESAAYGFDDAGCDLALLSSMSRAANRQVNWNSVLLRYPGKPDIYDRQLRSADVGEAAGATIVPMIIPHNFRVRTDFLDSDVGFKSQPSFNALFDLPRHERLAALQRPELRAALTSRLDAATDPRAVAFRGGVGDHRVSDVGPTAMQGLVGRSVSDIAAERNADVLTTIFDLAVEAGLDIGFARHAVPVMTPEDRALRRQVLHDPRLVLGASDGGAHVRGVVNVEYSTASFAELVRDDDIFTVEELVQEFTDIPARLYGLTDRGRIETGAWADVVVFDPETMNTSPVSLKHDLPGGSTRLFSQGVGIDAVFVAGESIVQSGEFTGARPGQLLRSGRDSATPDRTQLLERVRAANAGELCLGVDIGGTFTDCVLSDGTRTWRAKSPTTPGALGQGVLAAATLVAERRGASLGETLPSVVRFGLGTTAVTNVLASGTGRKVGVLATAGFEEMLLYARGARIVDEDGWIDRPGQIVDKHAIAPIQERIDRHGDVLTPLDGDAVERAARRLIDDEGVEAIAVSFLWSFLNPVHEDEAVAVIRAAFPDMTVVSGAELHPAAREYERTTFAVLNVYVSGALGGIEELETDLRDFGLSAPLLLVHSGGGSMTVSEARRRPLGLAVSGPAAGVAAAVTVASTSGADNVITCDMGGTSFDVSIIANGEPARRTRGDLMGVWTALSLVDVESIGAGGGSLGWIDARGMLRVGPQSAGAVPGPACYGRGGTDATVTDALVVLGYIDPDRFLGGEFELDADAARAACARLGESLGLDADETAWGIRELALAGMIKATRARTGALGLDPREHALLSFGGSGALFSPDIAAAIGAPTVLVPELASVLSAFGAATTDIRRERLRAVLMKVPGDPSLIEKLVTELATAVRADLAADGVAPDAQSVSFEADVRFFKQSYELQIPFTDAAFNADAMDRVVAAFRTEYTKRYGHGSVTLGVPIELIAVRAIGVGHTTQAELQHRAGDAGLTAAEPVGTRSVRLDRNTGGPQVVPAFDGPTLQPGHTITGPALIDGSDTTIWLPANASASVDEFGTLVMEVWQ